MLRPAALRTDTAAALWRVLSTAALVSLFTVFAIAHFQRWHSEGSVRGLGLVLDQALLAALFLLRRPARRVSGAPADWLLALGGTWLVLALRPAGRPLFGLDAPYLALQLVALAGTLLALGVLGRCFGIVAADRGLKTSGPYALVRHPVYATYLVGQIGYLLQNPSAWNLGVILLATACQLGRIHAEERLLRADPAYAAYAARVRWRLLPHVY
ncbi:MAG TPA: methyltransferase [Dehalococcoidia bacterium]|nr:methyltransferase [Dehalococcoidia bacterium]